MKTILYYYPIFFYFKVTNHMLQVNMTYFVISIIDSSRSFQTFTSSILSWKNSSSSSTSGSLLLMAASSPEKIIAAFGPTGLVIGSITS